MNKYTKHIKQDYQRKNLRNPFFHKPKSGVKTSWLKWLVPLSIALVATVFWFFLASPVWRLNQVTINGLTRAPFETVEGVIWNATDQDSWLGLSRRNIFLFDTETVCQQLIDTYNLTDCEISKKFLHELVVTGFERPYAFIWQEKNDIFYASSDGYIIKDQKVTEEDKGKYFILENKNPDSLIGQDNKINVNSDYLGFAFKLSELITHNRELSLEKFMIDWEFNTLKVKFKDGPEVYFNTRDQADTQLDRLLLVKKEKIKDNFSKTEYIDLRYGDKIFINPDFN
jgi:cell division septal protein FtsQ